MGTNCKTLLIHRKEAEKHANEFAINPTEIADKSYIHMYIEYDGYMEFMGVELAQWVNHMRINKGFNNFTRTLKIAEHLTHDFDKERQRSLDYDDDIEVKFTYIIWCGSSDVWISQWNHSVDECNFAGPVEELIQKFKENHIQYTNWNLKPNTNKKG